MAELGKVVKELHDTPFKFIPIIEDIPAKEELLNILIAPDTIANFDESERGRKRKKKKKVTRGRLRLQIS